MRKKLFLGLIAGFAIALWFCVVRRTGFNSENVAELKKVSGEGSEHGRPASEFPPNRSRYTWSAPGAAHAASEPRWQEELRALAANEDPIERSEGFERLAATMSEDESIAALRKLMEAPLEDPLAEFRSLLIRRWAERNPSEAAAWIAKWPENAVTREANSLVTIVWADADLPGALAWVQSLPDGETKTAAQVSLGYEAVRSDPRAALGIAVQLSEGPKRDRLLSHAARNWAATDPLEAVNWVSQIQDNGTRQRLLGDIAIIWAELDPWAAASAAVKGLPPGEGLERCVIGIIQRWAQQAPEDAAKWIEKFPTTNLKDVAAQNLVVEWAANNDEALARWLATLPAGSLRDSAVASYAIVLAPRDHRTALEWIKTITDDARRSSSLESVRRLESTYR